MCCGGAVVVIREGVIGMHTAIVHETEPLISKPKRLRVAELEKAVSSASSEKSSESEFTLSCSIIDHLSGVQVAYGQGTVPIV